jgi:pimeloyl-ACP methyl ester carboxylesterase
MALSHFTSGKTQAAFRAQYAAALAALWPVPFEQRQVTTSFGPTHVVVSGPASGAPLVLLHAAGTTALLWHRQIADLSATHRVFAVDILGDIGLSEQTRSLRTRPDAAHWLRDVLRALELRRPCFVGASFGGFLATNLAVHDPAKVGALALLAPAATLLPFKLSAQLAIRLGGLVPMPFTVAPALRKMLSGKLPDRRFVALMQAGVRHFRYDRTGIFPGVFSDDELRGLACPVLLVLGQDELIYAPDAAARRARRLLRSVEIRLLEGHGHLPGMQSPERVDAWILALAGACSDLG